MSVADELITRLALDVVERIHLPSRPERRVGVPGFLLSGPLGGAVEALLDGRGMWSHQAAALDILDDGGNVVVNTGTASGKSLVFQLYALDRVARDGAARAVVMYPLKALASDQFDRWTRMAEHFGMPPEIVGRIDGDVPTHDRDRILRDARIVIATPDVCQAWLMRNVGTPSVRRFLDGLCLLVLDEAHVYESVFGSNVAFLLRRLLAAKRRATAGRRESGLRVVAATATILDPGDYLSRLTGLPFQVISEEESGAPAHERTLVHVNGPEAGAGGEAAVADIVRGALSSEAVRFIAFLDSRQGVERVVLDLDDAGVMPYRSGYEASDRRRIETALRQRGIRGVVSTSALELGIDIADMTLGINLGVPQSRKAFRQRIGRVGRTSPGVFFVIAPPQAFRRFGETFEDYFRASVEPSYLYLGNRFIQFAHARCLHDETEVLQGQAGKLPAGADWPEGFDEVLKYTSAGARPKEFDLVAQIGSDNPHYNYPLRQVGDPAFRIVAGPAGPQGQEIGQIATNQAIREAYPGAQYLHFGKAYRVLEWRNSVFERAIRVAPVDKRVPTKPLLKKTVTYSPNGDGVVGGRLRRSKSAVVAEVHLQVNESVEGLRIGSTTQLYRDLRAENPSMSRKQRDFRTTGVLIQISQPWFAGSGPAAAAARREVAEGLASLLCRDRSMSPQDVDAVHTNIAALEEAGPRRRTDAVVVYDAIYGGLRLTEELYEHVERYAEQLLRAAGMAGQDALVSADTAERLLAAVLETVEADAAEADLPAATPEGWLQVYRPGSVVGILSNGVLQEREVVEPRLFDPVGLGEGMLGYVYKNPRNPKGLSFVPHAQVQATGQDWSWVLWNPATGELRELEGDEPNG